MFDMFSRIGEIKQKVEQTKQSLKLRTVHGEAENGAVRVEVSGDRRIRNISISPTLLEGGDTEYLEDVLLVAINRGLEQAEQLEASELKEAAGGLLPPGFNL